MSIKSEYRRLRSNLLSRVNYASRQFGIDKKDFTPSIPKKITTGSINRLKALNKKLTEKIHEVKVESGYYTHKQRQKDASIPQKQWEFNEAGQKKNIKTSHLPSQSNALKKEKVRPTPSLTDMILDVFESEMSHAQMYIHPTGNAKWQHAVQEAGYEAEAEFDGNIRNWLNKQLKNEAVRREVSKNLYHNFHLNYDDLERFLYDFESDFNGTLVHVDGEGNYRLRKLISVAFRLDLSDFDTDDYDNDIINSDDDVYKGEY